MYVKHPYHLKEIHASTWTRLVMVTLFSAGVEVAYEYLHWKILAIPIAVPAILGTAISLILGFRTNAAYDRWWEARKVWGAIVNDSRSLVRQLQVLLGPEQRRELERLALRQMAWCYTLAGRLRGTVYEDQVANLLTEDEQQQLQAHSNQPNALLLFHEHQLEQLQRKGKISDFQFVHLSETLGRLCDAMGKCERIKNTVFPTHYSIYIRFTILVFVFMLPFGLVETLGWTTVVITGLVTLLFLTIEHLAVELQTPFANDPNDTPMSALSRTIEINLRQMVDLDPIPEPMKPKDGYLM